MIEKRTVFILGAGASCPYGFPTGKELDRDIRDNFAERYTRFLEGWDERRLERLGNGYPMPAKVDEFLEFFRKPPYASIDLFLSRHPGFELVGKMAICLSILYSERVSPFEDPNNREHDWYTWLFHLMTRELITPAGYQDFYRNKVAFVTFNYDRSLEYFLFKSLHSFEGAETQKVNEQLCQVPVIHVYGQVGNLKCEANQSGVEYAKDIHNLSTVDLLRTAEDIHIMHSTRQKLQLEKVREIISGAERVFFLGFGYAKENLEALGFPGVLKPHHHVYGTAKDCTPKEIKDQVSRFAQGFVKCGIQRNPWDKVTIYDCDCVRLLRDHI